MAAPDAGTGRLYRTSPLYSKWQLFTTTPRWTAGNCRRFALSLLAARKQPDQAVYAELRVTLGEHGGGALAVDELTLKEPGDDATA